MRVNAAGRKTSIEPRDNLSRDNYTRPDPRVECETEVMVIRYYVY